ncbi:rhodanese-like domain-containing protein [Hahella ganghwensis]|uniref:rhodanese-like domain-containing protein n=1 Tax=Hahella ganghwensis TaxID=286420 RepID=UPI0014613FF8|nr:rhodanese-like domain-containing protein [Hahella ganghwensis]
MIGRRLATVFFSIILVLPSLSWSDSASDAWCAVERDYWDQRVITEYDKFNQDHSCFVDVDDINLKGITIIDTRHASEFEKASIPGSYNLPVSFLQRESRFKEKRLLLVNKGIVTADNARTCFQLKSSGFTSVSILEGGLAAWVLAGQKINALPKERESLSQVTEKEFVESLVSSSSILVAGEAWYNSVSKVVPASAHIAVIKEGQDYQKAISQSYAAALNQNKSFIVLSRSLSGSTSVNLRNVFTYRGELGAVHRQFLIAESVAKKRTALPDRYKCKGRS